jgi:hypothetical protein
VNFWEQPTGVVLRGLCVNLCVLCVSILTEGKGEDVAEGAARHSLAQPQPKACCKNVGRQGNEGQRNKTDAIVPIPLTHIPLPFPRWLSRLISKSLAAREDSDGLRCRAADNAYFGFHCGNMIMSWMFS